MSSKPDTVPGSNNGETIVNGLRNRVHTYSRPENKAKLTEFFTNILDCSVVALPGNMLAFRFPNGASLSVEFTQDALDEQQARWGAWLEVEVENPSALKMKVLAAGLPQVKHPISDRFYFLAPGGQVWGIAES